MTTLATASAAYEMGRFMGYLIVAALITWLIVRAVRSNSPAKQQTQAAPSPPLWPQAAYESCYHTLDSHIAARCAAGGGEWTAAVTAHDAGLVRYTLDVGQFDQRLTQAGWVLTRQQFPDGTLVLRLARRG